MRGISPDTTTHSFAWLIPADVYYDEVNCPDTYHPEYFPLINGVRVRSTDPGPQLCISNPDVKKIIANKAYSAFKTYPKMKCFGIVPNDSYANEEVWCQCPACQALDGAQAGTGNYSNRLMSLVNYVAEALHSYFPDRYIGTLAYSDFRKDPDVNVSDNVFVVFCASGRNLMRKLTDPCDVANSGIMQKLNGWISKADNVSLYDYYWYSGLSRCPSPFSHTLVQEFSDLKALGLKGISSETATWCGWWDGLSLTSYTFARASWDTSLSFDAILTDYCNKRYGPAATIMKSYHNLYESTITNRVSTLRAINGPGEQYIPWAFTTTEINTLDGYLTNAASTVGLNALQTAAIAGDRKMFSRMCALRIDPATISDIGANIIPNPDIENSALSWLTHSWSDDYDFSVPASGAHSGSKCLKIQCTGIKGLGRWYQTGIPIQNGRKYAIRFWVRANGQAKGDVTCYFGSNIIEIGVGDSNDQWVQVVCPEITSNGSSLGIYLESSGTGNIFYDDIFVAILPD